MESKKVNKTNLGFVGVKGQMRAVKSIIEDKQLFVQVHPYLNPEAFTEEGLKAIIRTLNEYYDTKGMVATYKDLEYLLKGKAKTDEELNDARSILTQLSSENLLEGMDTSTELCVSTLRTIEMERILSNMLRSVKNTGYDAEKVTKLNEQLQILEKNVSDGGVFAGDLFDSIIDEPVWRKVPTCIPELDEKMNGGLTIGTLGLLIAGTGVGKSTLASIMCCNAALAGFNVVQIFFEDTVNDIGKKHYARLTGRYTSEFQGSDNRAALRDEIYNSHPEAYNALNTRLKLKKMHNGTTTVEDIKAYIKYLKTAQGWKPDMIFIDYIGCMQTSSNQTIAMQNEWQAYERLTKRIESLASDEDCAIWIAQQTNRDGQKSNDTARQGIANVQGSFRITQPCSAILYLDKMGCEKNTANLKLEKCRGGEPTSWKNIFMNNGTCQIDLSEVDTHNDPTKVFNENYFNNQTNNIPSNDAF